VHGTLQGTARACGLGYKGTKEGNDKAARSSTRE